MLNNIKIIVSILLLFSLTSCKENSENKIVKSSYVFETMADIDGNMILPLNTDVTLITTSEDKKQGMRDTTKQIIEKYQTLLDPSHYYVGVNNICVLNENYGKDAIRVSPLLIDILEKSIELSQDTNGFFNPTMGTLSDVWKDRFSNEHINIDPSSDEIEHAKSCVIGHDELKEYIVIDKLNNTITFKQYPKCDSKVKIDLGAYAKGYVLDKVYEELIKFDSGFLISAGGSSIVTYVPEHQQDTLNWSVGVKSPNTLQQCYVFKVKTSFISTSGDEQQYFINEDGIRRHHILNPYTGYSENIYRDITLVSSSNAGLLDGLTTAMFSIEDENLTEFINSIEKTYNVNIIKALMKEDSNSNLILNADKEFLDIILDDYTSKEITITK